MRKLTLALIAAVTIPVVAEAQAGFYPSFQPTRVAEREYNFGFVDFDGGSALLFQWREGVGTGRSQFTVDLGLADSDGPVNNDGALMIGGSYHYQLTRASNDMPFDMVFGGGLGITAGDGYNILRLPFGVAVGHRFPLEGEFAITPFVHPRLSIDRYPVDGGGDDTDTNVDLDIGGTFEINPRMSIRIAATIGNSDAVGVSFAWTPRGLR